MGELGPQENSVLWRTQTRQSRSGHIARTTLTVSVQNVVKLPAGGTCWQNVK